MSLLKDRRLSALLAAEVVSSLGTQMTWLALPWFVLRTTGSPQRMTWVIIAEILPVAVLGFWGGAIAARVGTRRTMLVCDLLRAPLLASIPVLHSLGLLPFPVLLAIVSSLRNKPLPEKLVAFGEIGLAGEVRPVQRGQERLREAAKLGFKLAIIPKANAPRTPIEGIEVVSVERVEEAVARVR